jgi:hypothetical protein
VIEASDLSDIICAVCPHCSQERPLEQRASTREWQHRWKTGDTTHITLCLATHLRNNENYKGLIK